MHPVKIKIGLSSTVSWPNLSEARLGDHLVYPQLDKNPPRVGVPRNIPKRTRSLH